jgi:anti-sigma factor RsiW
VTQADGGMEPAVQIESPRAPASQPPSTFGVADVAHGVVRSRMSEYLADTLSTDERARIDGHVASCRDCAAYLATLRATVDLIGALPARQAPARVREAISRRAREQTTES